jgi:hypothetical protein
MKFFGDNPYKTLTRMVALNIVLDVAAIAIWYSLPGSGGNLLHVETSIAMIEAAIAAGLFAIALLGLTKKQQWAPTLAIVITVAQRIFATYVFFPSPGILATLIWSIIIVYFGYKTIKSTNPQSSRI